MFLRILCLVLLLGAPAGSAAAYSVLTHQALIDSTWDGCLALLLRRRYPGATEAQLDEARSYAYGGAILQDMGYYPLGSDFFTNLTHYVRAGDFVRNLLAEARDRNEYAFALGTLAHYAADNVGHPEGTNRIIAAVYPGLQQKFGPVITYEQAPLRHTELEFSFDVVQVAAGRYRTQHFHRFIGFRVSKPVLERAFALTYGLELRHILLNVDADVATFRFAVNQLLPVVARAAWQTHRHQIQALSPGIRRRDYVRPVSAHALRRKFGREYERPGFGARLLATTIKLLPRVGPLKKYAFTLPDSAGEAGFRRSYQLALTSYCALVSQQPTNAAAPAPALPDTNLDTGQPTRPAAYALADQTYARLLRELCQRQFQYMSPALHQALLGYFTTGIPTPAQEAEQGSARARYHAERARARTEQALTVLRSLP